MTEQWRTIADTIGEGPAIPVFHGTSRLYEGVPSAHVRKGSSKDILHTSTLSTSPDPEVAEFFAGGQRDSRVYETAIPREAMLDLRKVSKALVDADKMDELSALIKEAEASGRYKAVAIIDITMGGDAPEVRLLQPMLPESWTVEPSEESTEIYGPIEDTLQRVRANTLVNPTAVKHAVKKLRGNEKMLLDMIQLKGLLSRKELKAYEQRLAATRAELQTLKTFQARGKQVQGTQGVRSAAGLKKSGAPLPSVRVRH